jgi:hypothetical protein
VREGIASLLLSLENIPLKKSRFRCFVGLFFASSSSFSTLCVRGLGYTRRVERNELTASRACVAVRFFSFFRLMCCSVFVSVKTEVGDIRWMDVR